MALSAFLSSVVSRGALWSAAVVEKAWVNIVFFASQRDRFSFVYIG